MKHGIEKIYYTNGKICVERPYYYGFLMGTEIQYDENGNVIKKLKFVYNRLVSQV